jgi:hypothetical protein
MGLLAMNNDLLTSVVIQKFWKNSRNSAKKIYPLAGIIVSFPEHAGRVTMPSDD